RLPALRPVRRALPHRGLGHAAILSRSDASRVRVASAQTRARTGAGQVAELTDEKCLALQAVRHSFFQRRGNLCVRLKRRPFAVARRGGRQEDGATDLEQGRSGAAVSFSDVVSNPRGSYY